MATAGRRTCVRTDLQSSDAQMPNFHPPSVQFEYLVQAMHEYGAMGVTRLRPALV